MQLEEYFDFHTEPVEHIRIKGTRIDISFVIDLYKRHMTPAQIAVHFGCPLDLLQVYATITYYLQNTAAVEAYLERGEQRFQEILAAERAKPKSPVVERLQALKKQFTDARGRLDVVALRQHLDRERIRAVTAS